MNTDSRSSVTRGRGPIVLRVENNYGFHEHGTIGQAKAEAARLAEQVGGEFVVYVPVATVSPAPKTITVTLVPPSLRDDFDKAHVAALHDDDLPF